MIKNDGCVSIHNETSNKPLNYMGKGSILTEEQQPDGTLKLTADSRKENLTIYLYEVISDINLEIDEEDEGLIKDGTEDHLQEWLAQNPQVIREDLELIQREYPTGSGPVDLLMKDTTGQIYAVEVKRVAMLGTVYQTLRYVDALQEEHPGAQGIIAALDIRPKTEALAEKRNLTCTTIPANWNQKTEVLPEH